MNVQVNFNGGLKESEIINSLNVIAYSIKDWIEEYKNDVYRFESVHSRGTMLTRVNMNLKCNGKTMFIKVKAVKQ